ncbi:34033_t:CDS:2, partial [Gigaspora margarita]
SSVTYEAFIDATISHIESMKIGDDCSAPVTSQGPPPPIQQMQRFPPPIQQIQGPPSSFNKQIQGSLFPNKQMQ